jgi:secreted PhoX family phosphatase
VLVCEDEVTKGDGVHHLLGVTPDGKCYRLGRNVMNGSEVAGATFSPDGSTLFMNIQTPGLTLAITGPWKAARAG